MQQGPVVVAGRLPGIHGGLAGQQAQLLLPVAQGVRVTAVDLHRGEQGLCAMFAQPGVQAFGETAEVLILPVAQPQDGVIQASQARCPAQYLALETAGAVRCFAVAEGADHEQGIVRFMQVLLADVRQWLHFDRQACGLQLSGGLPCQLFGKTTLAGEADQPRRRVAGGLHEIFARILDLAFFAPTIQVQYPAGDEEQRHGQRGDGQDNAPDDAEVTTDVQRIDAGQQLRLEALVAVAINPFDHAGGRVEGDLVQGAVVRRSFQQEVNGRRLAGHGRHAHVIGAELRAGRTVDAAPHRRVIGRRCRTAWRRAASAANAFALW
ncbi:hypothetical protein D9M69_454640 [compost metagenome]